MSSTRLLLSKAKRSENFLPLIIMNVDRFISIIIRWKFKSVVQYKWYVVGISQSSDCNDNSYISMKHFQIQTL